MAFKAEGLAERLAEAIKACGYVTADGRPDIPRFVKTHEYDKQSVYKWVKDTMPDNAALEMLDKDLGIPWQWLVIGDDGYRTIKRWIDERESGAAAIARIRPSPRRPTNAETPRKTSRGQRSPAG